MEERQAKIEIKLEQGVEVPRLPVGVPRVTGLGTEHLEAVMELSKVAKLSSDDFATIIDYLPLYTTVITQLNYAEKNKIPPKKLMEQINDAMTKDDESVDDNTEEGSLDTRDNVYEYDGFVVPDDEIVYEDDSVVDTPKAEKRKRVELELDALDVAEYKIKLKKARLMVKKYKKKLGINKKRLVSGRRYNNPIIIID